MSSFGSSAARAVQKAPILSTHLWTVLERASISLDCLKTSRKRLYILLAISLCSFTPTGVSISRIPSPTSHISTIFS